MSRSATAPYLIAGGGIGGLTAALAFVRRDVPSIVLEREAEAERSGSGIQLGPNATRILFALGLEGALRRVSCRPEAIRMFDGRSGRALAHVPLGDAIEKRHGAPYLVLRRADLHAVLQEAVAASPIEYRAPFELASWTQDAGGVAVTDTRGHGTQGTALIGADGLWSYVRSQLSPALVPRFAGHAAWRALIPMERLSAPFTDNITGLWFGPAAHVVHYPVCAGAALNVVAVVPDHHRHPGWDTQAEAEAIAAAFRGWCDPIRLLIDTAREWRIWSLYRMRSPSRWSAGPVTLLGDAAHPVVPYLAQGAALAIEDAHVLAGEVAADPTDPASAFARYEKRRRGRVAHVQRHAARLGYLYHLRWPADAIRNWGLMTQPSDRLLARLDWLYAQHHASDAA